MMLKKLELNGRFHSGINTIFLVFCASRDEDKNKQNETYSAVWSVHDVANPGKWITCALLRRAAYIFNQCPTPLF